MPGSVVRLAVALALGLVVGACGEGECPTRTSDLEIIDALNEDLGLQVERPEEPILLEEEYAEAVARRWHDLDSIRDTTVSGGNWIARVEGARGEGVEDADAAFAALAPDEWVVATSRTLWEVSSGLGNESFFVTVRIVARLRRP